MTNPVAWIGIDPGATGAIAVLTSDGNVAVYDFPGDERALTDLVFDIHMSSRVQMVIMEQQQAMPQQGVSSVFKIGMNYGMWLAAIAARGWPMCLVRPAAWKKGHGYPAPPAKVKGQEKADRKRIMNQHKKALKAHSLTVARRTFPQAADRLTRSSMDHDRAEALLLADLARKQVFYETE